ncbi:Cop c 2-like protein [Microthyrium microscopicum]|uniref:Thioredoxin n=1 Tax=Microthyrium microscopicum TaxID=703497 RepID=A0A6A6UIY9_9PEZI|nr:Cop c 2-like protein [Microthyrium microscopicum]
MADIKATAGAVHNLETKADFDKYITGGEGVAVLDAFAEWCGPCKMIAPHIKTMSEKTDKVKFYKFDVDALPAVAQELNIRAMPTFIVYKDGEEVQKIVGANIKAIETAIASADASESKE